MRKIKISTVILFLLIPILAGISLILINKQGDKLGPILETEGAQLSGIENFKIKNNNLGNLFAEKRDEVIKIKILKDFNEEKASNYIKDQNLLLEGVFEPQLPPYPEFLTRETGCGEKYKPVKKESEFGTYQLLYAGKRFGYGICADDLIEYRASFGFFYCPVNETLFELRYFIPKDSNPSKLQNLNDSFVCI